MEQKGKSKGKGKDKGKGYSSVVCWTCGKQGHRAADCFVGKGMGKGVSNVEEKGTEQEEENVNELDAGGVFWLNTVGKGCCSDELFQRPKKTANWCCAKEDSKMAGIPVNNRYSALEESEDVVPPRHHNGGMWMLVALNLQGRSRLIQGPATACYQSVL